MDPMSHLDVAPAALRAEFERILSSQTFSSAPRVKQLLRYLAERYLNGNTGPARELTIAVEVFNRSQSFEPRIDPIVRVEICRLRAKLKEYYGDGGGGSSIRISVPRGAYRIAVLPADSSLQMSVGQRERKTATQVASALDTTPVTRTLAAAPDPEQARPWHGGIARWSGWPQMPSLPVIGAALLALSVVGLWLMVRTSTSRVRASQRPADSMAIELYKKGRFLLEQRSFKELVEAENYFEQAIARDANYAPAYAGLADAYILQGFDADSSSLQLAQKAEIAAQKAIEHDDTLAAAHVSVGAVRAVFQWDWEGAQREFQRALTLDPDSPQAHHWYAVLFLVPMGRRREAVEEVKTALRLDPASPILNTDLGWLQYLGHDFKGASEQYKKTLELSPHFVPAHFRLSQLYETTGDYANFVAEQRSEFLDMGSTDYAAQIQAAFGRGGYKGYLKWYASLVEQSNRNDETNFASAYLALKRADYDTVFLALDHAVRIEHLPAMIFLPVDPEFAPLHADQRFASLVHEIGLPAAPMAQ